MPLRKICRRPETDHRLQQLHAVNEAAPVDQQKTSMDQASVHAIKVTSSAETVPMQQNPNIAIVAPVQQVNVAPPAQPMNVDPKNAETAGDIKAGNPMVPSGIAAFPHNIVTSSVPVVSSQNEAEGK